MIITNVVFQHCVNMYVKIALFCSIIIFNLYRNYIELLQYEDYANFNVIAFYSKVNFILNKTNNIYRPLKKQNTWLKIKKSLILMF